MAAIGHVETLPVHALEAHGEVVVRPSEQKSCAQCRLLCARLVAGEGRIGHVVGGMSRVPEGLRRKLADCIDPPGAVTAGLAPVARAAALHTDHLVLLAPGVSSGMTSHNDCCLPHGRALACNRCAGPAQSGNGFVVGANAHLASLDCLLQELCGFRLEPSEAS